MTTAVSEVMEEGHLTLDDIDWVCTHQANKRIIDSVRQHLGAPDEKVIVNIDHVGSTSSASIPIALHEAAQQGKLHSGDYKSNACLYKPANMEFTITKLLHKIGCTSFLKYKKM